MSKPQSWIELCRSAKFSGMWVALDNCRFNPDTRQPMEGDVVDADEELALLCGMRESGRSNCAILFCDDDVLVEERRPTPVPSLRPAMSRPD